MRCVFRRVLSLALARRRPCCPRRTVVSSPVVFRPWTCHAACPRTSDFPESDKTFFEPLDQKERGARLVAS